MPISWKQLKLKRNINEICELFDKEAVTLPVEKIQNTGVRVSYPIKQEVIEDLEAELIKIFLPLGWKIEIKPTGFEPIVPGGVFCFMPVEI
jgi:hypothetical protein